MPPLDGARLVLPLAVLLALALVVASRGSRRPWGGSAAWFALAVAGFGASLHLVDAPPAVAYQHYRVSIDGALDAMAWATLALQALLVFGAGRRHILAIVGWIRASVHPAGFIIALIVLVSTTAAPSREIPRYVTESLLAASITVLALLTVAIAIRELPPDAGTRPQGFVARLLGPSDVPAPRHPDGWVLRVAALATLISALLALFVYERHPHVPDEVVYLLQARYLAEGMLTMPLPPVPAGFDLDLMQYEPSRWFSPVPPGWPFALALGAWFGAPWLVNPVLGGISVVLTYLLLGELYDRRTARLATLLLAGSPWFLFMSMNFMGHALTLMCALAAALGVAVTRRTGSLLAALVGGIFVGAVSLIRPLEGLAVALLLGLWSLAARGRRFRFAPSAALVSGAVLSGALVLPYNAALTGSPKTFPIMAYVDKYHSPGANDLGFGANRGLGWSGLDPFPGHGAPDVAVNALLNTFSINVEFLGWPLGVAVLLALVWSLRGRSWVAADVWLAAAVAVIAGIHSFYWFSGGPDFGARYWYLVIVPLAGLAARGVLRSGEPEARAPARRASAGVDQRPLVATLALTALALTLFVPWRSLGKYHHYRGMRADIPRLAREHGFAGGLVLVRGRRFPDYASAAAYNPVDLSSAAAVYVWDVAPEVREASVQAFRDRPIWIVDGPTLTGAGFRVVAGPLTAEAVLHDPAVPGIAVDATLARDPVSPRRGGAPR